MHFLAYLSYILANEPQESDEKGKGKGKKVLSDAAPYYARKLIL